MTAPDRQRLLTLLEASRALGAGAGLAETLARTLDTAVRLTAADRGVLVLLNKATGAFDVREVRGADAEPLAGLAHEAAHGGESRANGSVMATPLRGRAGVIGAVAVDRTAPFAADDLISFEIFANQAAIAVDANLAKSEFVSTVTHELRLPMTSIKGYTDLLRGGMVGPVSDMQKQLLDTVRNNVDWMNGLISDLSDISKLDAGRLKLDIGPVDVAETIHAAVSAQRPHIEARTQTLTLNLSPTPPVLADRARLEQIVNYLLTNANRYTPAGGHITVSAAAAGGFARLAVADTGVGIAPGDRAKLFTQFFRSEHPAVREHKGWGLALHLVKRLVEKFGGEIGVETEFGKGSTFWFTVPVAG